MNVLPGAVLYDIDGDDNKSKTILKKHYLNM